MVQQSEYVRFYGCPAEESPGRVPLARAGRFDEFEIAVTWHPADVNILHRDTSRANISLVFAFTERAAAAQSPARNAKAWSPIHGSPSCP